METNMADVDRGDVDGLLVLAAIIPEELPQQFLKVLNALDEYFDDSTVNPIDEIVRLFEVLRAHKIVQEHDAASNTSITLLSYFELNDSNKTRVLILCSDMRKIVLASTDFDQSHKVRLSNRIAAMEAEINKPKGLFDVILGGVSDLGETLNKFGTEIKPLTDRMGEVLKITRSSTKEYDKLPLPEEIKQLPPPDESDEE
jgi:hypothetical protein